MTRRRQTFSLGCLELIDVSDENWLWSQPHFDQFGRITRPPVHAIQPGRQLRRQLRQSVSNPLRSAITQHPFLMPISNTSQIYIEQNWKEVSIKVSATLFVTSTCIAAFALSAPYAAAQHQHGQAVEDARALVLENWEPQARTIKLISFAHDCGVIDDMSAKSTIQSIQREMDDFESRNGIFDGNPDVFAYSKEAIRRGAQAAREGACD